MGACRRALVVAGTLALASSPLVASASVIGMEDSFQRTAGSCRAQDVYALGASPTGDYSIVRTDAPTRRTTDAIVLDGLASGVIPDALGVTSSGTEAIVATDEPLLLGDRPRIYRISLMSGQTSPLRGAPTVDPGSADQPGIRAGAINPVNGLYYYGHVTARGDAWALYAFDPARGVPIGFVGEVTASAGPHGDLAFSANGDLFLASSGEAAATSLVQVDGPELPRTTQGRHHLLPFTSLGEGAGEGGPTEGVATVEGIGDEFVYGSALGDLSLRGSGNGRAITRPAGRAHSTLTSVTDLASCVQTSGAVTLTTRVDRRETSSDQFTLSITSGSRVASVTTTGDRSGPQAASAGPLLGTAEEAFTLRVSNAGGADLQGYSSRLVCTKSGTSDEVATTEVGNGVYQLAPAAPVQGAIPSIGCESTLTARVDSPDPAAPAPATAATPTSEPGAPTPVAAQPAAGEELVAAVQVDLTCTSGQFNTLTAAGRIGRVVSPTVVTVDDNGWTLQVGTYGADALGVSPNGTTAFALDPYGTNTVNILKYDKATDVYSIDRTYTLPNGSSSYMVAGAVSPIDGHYYFGGYTAFGGEDFWLYEYDPVAKTVQYLGYIDPLTFGPTSPANGDIAFDAQGNLFLVYSVGSADQMYRVARATLDAAAGSGLIAATVINSNLTENTGEYNGLVWDSGTVGYLQSGTPLAQPAGDPTTTIATANPTTSWSMTAPVALTGVSYGTDSANCFNVPTVVVKKNVVGRVNSTDQFQLNVYAGTTESGTPVARATTTGTATGVQPVTAEALLTTGATYTINEAPSGLTTQLSQYVTSWACLRPDGTTYSSGSGVSFQFVAPATALAVTCTITNSVAPQQPLQCTSGTYYMVTEVGDLRQVSASTSGVPTGTATMVEGNTAAADTNGFGSLTLGTAGGYPQWNALALSADGTKAYAIMRTATTYRIARYDALSDSYTWMMTAAAAFTPSTLSIIGGSVAPDGKYYFGGWVNATPDYFQLYVWDPANPTPSATVVGQVNATISTGAGATQNGDMAFDGQGNLYLLYNVSTASQTQIITVPSASLSAAVSNPSTTEIITSEAGPIQNTGTESVNGLAFDAQGFMYVEKAGTTTSHKSVDPNTLDLSAGAWVTISASPANPPMHGIGTDLASCMSPPTIKAIKNLPDGRVGSDDQFKLDIRRVDIATTVFGTGTTTGAESGLQTQVESEIAGPTLAMSGKGYSITESGVNANLSEYTTSWTCTSDVLLTGWPISGSGTSLTLSSFPSPITGGAAPNITCVFTNTPRTTLTLVKTVVGGTALPAQWTLSAASSGQSIAGATGTAAVTNQLISSGTSYALGETLAQTSNDASYYVPDAWICVAGAGGAPPVVSPNGNSVIAQPGTNVTCTITNRFQMFFLRKDGASGPIGGAQFAIYQDLEGAPAPTPYGSAPQALSPTGSTGLFQFGALPIGTYWLEEVTAPDGYVLLAEPVQFTVNAAGAFTLGITDPAGQPQISLSPDLKTIVVHDLESS